MNAPSTHWKPARSSAPTIFNKEARAKFGAHYPEGPHQLRHALDRHPLLEIDALADLAERLPETSVEYNRGDLPIGVDGKPDANGLSIADTIRHVHEANSWAVLKNVEQVPSYEALLSDLLGELKEEIEAKTGPMLTPQGFIFISSPNAVTPYHFDPEHNILLQVAGSKTMTQFQAGNPKFASDEMHESYHSGGPRELRWEDDFLKSGWEFHLGQGEAVYVPVMAPHFVRNGPDSSISLSITWRSKWSYDESDARCTNALMRRVGLTPRATKRWPATNLKKSLAFRAWRKVFGRWGLQ
ncbi:transcriptional regulator [uncultured Erythrobacter sp.]|uniref:transcriptional regulator n=1 Tax=uncultured Erythrobacter sp. TaxID=263913 RepID=UPI00261B322D|nr:transcriptional regulator [uncultured Erythrobacter sp.]